MSACLWRHQSCRRRVSRAIIVSPDSKHESSSSAGSAVAAVAFHTAVRVFSLTDECESAVNRLTTVLCRKLSENSKEYV